MKKIRQIREEYNTILNNTQVDSPEGYYIDLALHEDTEKEAEKASFDKKIPFMIMLRRKSIRQFPNNQTVALYYAQNIDRYISIPFGRKAEAVIAEALKFKSEKEYQEWLKQSVKKDKKPATPTPIPVAPASTQPASAKPQKITKDYDTAHNEYMQHRINAYNEEDDEKRAVHNYRANQALQTIKKVHGGEAAARSEANADKHIKGLEAEKAKQTEFGFGKTMKALHGAGMDPMFAPAAAIGYGIGKVAKGITSLVKKSPVVKEETLKEKFNRKLNEKRLYEQIAIPMPPIGGVAGAGIAGTGAALAPGNRTYEKSPAAIKFFSRPGKNIKNWYERFIKKDKSDSSDAEEQAQAQAAREAAAKTLAAPYHKKVMSPVDTQAKPVAPTVAGVAPEKSKETGTPAPAIAGAEAPTAAAPDVAPAATSGADAAKKAAEYAAAGTLATAIPYAASKTETDKGKEPKPKPSKKRLPFIPFLPGGGGDKKDVGPDYTFSLKPKTSEAGRVTIDPTYVKAQQKLFGIKEDAPSSNTSSSSVKTGYSFKLKSTVKPTQRVTIDPTYMRAQQKLYGVNESIIDQLRELATKTDLTKDMLMVNEEQVDINSNIAEKVVKVYDSLNKKNKAKFAKMLGESKASFKKAVNFALRY